MATAKLDLTTSWQLVGAGPVVISLEIGALAMLHVADSLPAADAAAHRLRRSEPKSLTYEGISNIYAKKPSDVIENVSISYTGI